MRIVLLICVSIMLNGCGSLAHTLPYSTPQTAYDSFKKQWTVTSTRWGNDGTNIGANVTFLRAYVKTDGEPMLQIYSRIKTESKLNPSYALTSDGKRLRAQEVNRDIDCGSYNCTWTEDVIIPIDYNLLAQYLSSGQPLNIAIYGNSPKQVVTVLPCQFWEVEVQIMRIDEVDKSKLVNSVGVPCN